MVVGVSFMLLSGIVEGVGQNANHLQPNQRGLGMELELWNDKAKARSYFSQKRNEFVKIQKRQGTLPSLSFHFGQYLQSLFEQLFQRKIKSEKSSEKEDNSKQKWALRGALGETSANLTIASYRAIGSEVSTDSFPSSTHSWAQWVYPKIQGSQLEFLQPLSHTPTGFVKSSWGIEEPCEGSSKVSLDSIDIILIPGIAFDRRGHRLGTGKGFYDRTLNHYRGVKVGIAYAAQISSNDLATEEHDLPMDYVLTEKYMLRNLKT